MIHTGDCIEVMRGMEAESVDAVCTDPPYGLEFMGKAWDSPLRNGWQAEPGRYHNDTNFLATGDRVRYKAGPSFQAWCEAWGREALRVTKPGGYLLAFGGTRTHHRLVCGLEDAGWIIRDELDWIYASGFPKGKANLKPAHEPIVLARKPGPLRPLAIDECRIAMSPADAANIDAKHAGMDVEAYDRQPGHSLNLSEKPMPLQAAKAHDGGRWPSNVLLSDPELFDEPNPYVVGSGATSETPYVVRATAEDRGMYSPGTRPVGEIAGYGDSGGYSRFFIVPKSARNDREPVLAAVYCNCETVKPEPWVSEDRSRPEPTAITSPPRATSGGTTKAESDSSTMLFGSSTSDQSPKGSRSTTSTGTSSTTPSRTSSPSIPSPTSDSTPGASSSTGSGGSDAPSAPSTDRSTPSGGTSRRKAGRSTADAAPATSPESSRTNRCADCGREVKPSNGGPVEAGDGVAGARRNSHPT